MKDVGSFEVTSTSIDRVFEEYRHQISHYARIMPAIYKFSSNVLKRIDYNIFLKIRTKI